MLNVHTHRKPQVLNERVIRNAFIPNAPPKVAYGISMGLHPWHATVHWHLKVEALQGLLSGAGVMALGEVGLDRVHTSNWQYQLAAFEAQIALANAYDLPMILHCVRAYSDVFPYLKHIQPPVIFHDFRGNATQMRQLLDKNVYFSFGKSIALQPFAGAAVFLQTPPHRVFLETDSAPVSITAVYQAAADLWKTPVEEVQMQIVDNSTKVWKSSTFSHKNSIFAP